VIKLVLRRGTRVKEGMRLDAGRGIVGCCASSNQAVIPTLDRMHRMGIISELGM
jgi:hypothetical protein